MKVIERNLTSEKDGVPGYLAYPDRNERGPALLLVHQNTGVTDYIKIEALKFAKLGYTTIVPNLYELVGYPDVTHIHSGRQVQAKTSDAEFLRATTRGWNYLPARPDVHAPPLGVLRHC